MNQSKICNVLLKDNEAQEEHEQEAHPTISKFPKCDQLWAPTSLKTSLTLEAVFVEWSEPKNAKNL